MVLLALIFLIGILVGIALAAWFALAIMRTVDTPVPPLTKPPQADSAYRFVLDPGSDDASWHNGGNN